MTRLNGDLEKLIAKNASGADEVITISMDGGKGW